MTFIYNLFLVFKLHYKVQFNEYDFVPFLIIFENIVKKIMVTNFYMYKNIFARSKNLR